MISSLAVVLAASLADARAGGPRLQAPEAAWNFGAVTNQLALDHQFVLHNAGDAPLEITGVVSSCEVCLSAGVDTKSIPAGGTALLRCRLDLRRLSGRVNRTITVSSNDPEHPSLLFEVRGEVIPLFQVLPAEIYLELASGAKTAVARILPLSKMHAPISRVLMDNTNMIGQIHEAEKGQFELTVQPRPSLAPGRTRFQARAQSSDPRDPVCLVEGVVDNPADLEVIPPVLQFEATAAPQTRIIWLRQRAAAPLTLVDVVVPSDRVHALIEPDQSGINYRIEIAAWNEDAPESGSTNAVLLKLKNAENQERVISVPIRVAKPHSANQ